ncbi:hypothetical protein BDL97_02G043000 [Sphagnum fallax]|nr:hypothetical protein BDL97_02G043000 [Sphagnum fallax]
MSVDSWWRASLDKPDQLKSTMEETSILSWLTSNNGASLDRSQSTIIDKNRYVNHEVVKHGHIVKPHLSFYFEDSLPRSFANEAPEGAHTSSFGAQSQNPEVSWPQLGPSVDRMLGEHKQTLRLESLDIKDVVRESLHRRWPIMPKENSTKDCNTQGPFLVNQLSSGLGNLKKSSLVTSSGRDKSDLPCERQRMAQLMDVQSDLPCLCSANTRTGLHLHINKGCQMQFLLDSMEKDLTMLANDENFSTLGRCFGGNEVSRLTVELDDGPLISASSSSRRKMSPNAPGSYKPLDNTHCLKEVRDPCPPGLDFKDVLQASWQVRATSSDVCKDLPCAAPYPGLSDDTDVAVKNRSSGARGDHQETARCQETNVVARLMGLEKFPSFAVLKIPLQKPVFSKTQSREAELIQDLLQHTPAGLSGSPQASLLDESSQMSDRGGSGSCQIQEQRNTHSGEAHELRLRSPSSQSPKFMERMPLVFKQQDTCNAMKTRLAQTGKRLSEENLTVVQKSDYSTRHEPLYGDMAQLVRQLRLRNSVQERKALKQIQEAMKLKGLLHPPNHKLVQDLKSKTDPIMPKEHLQPQLCELNQQPVDSSKLTTTILNKGHTDLEHKETSRLGPEEYSMSLNTRTPEQMIQEPEKVKSVLLETNLQIVKNDPSIIVMKPMKTKVVSKLDAPKHTSLTYTTPAHSENGGPIKTAERKPQRAQARSNNRSSKDGLNVSQQPCWLGLNVTGEHEKASTVQSGVQESRNAGTVRVIEGEALNHSEDLCLQNPDVLGFSGNMRSCDVRAELEVASAEVMKDNNVTTNEGEVSELQSSPNSLGEKFELNESLPMVGGMEHSSPLYVLSNTGVEDEQPNPSPQSCTSTGINLRESNSRCGSLVENVDKEESASTVRKKLCFEIDSNKQQEELHAQVKTSGVEIELPFDSKNRTVAILGTTSITGTSLKNREEERQFVRDLLVVSELTKELPVAFAHTKITGPASILVRSQQRRRRKDDDKKRPHNRNNIPDGGCPKSKDRSTKEKKKTKKEKKKEILDRRLLYDAVSEIASTKLPLFLNPDLSCTTTSLLPLFLKPDLQGTTTSFAQQPRRPQQQEEEVSVQEPMMAQRWTEPTTAQRFAQEVWKELQQIPCGQFDDVHDTVQSALQKDMVEKLRQSYSEFRVEITEVGLEVERRIFKDLVQGVVAECFRTQEQQQPPQLRSTN